MHHGVPWDVAMNLHPVERTALFVIHGEFEGGKFDWSAMKWKEPK